MEYIGLITHSRTNLLWELPGVQYLVRTKKGVEPRWKIIYPIRWLGIAPFLTTYYDGSLDTPKLDSFHAPNIDSIYFHHV